MQMESHFAPHWKEKSRHSVVGRARRRRWRGWNKIMGSGGEPEITDEGGERGETQIIIMSIQCPFNYLELTRGPTRPDPTRRRSGRESFDTFGSQIELVQPRQPRQPRLYLINLVLDPHHHGRQPAQPRSPL